MSDESPAPEGATVEQIFFNCPKCGKSLAIDAQGEGYIVTCPDCQTEVQVPAAQVAAEVMSTTLGELRERLEAIARVRAHDRERFAKIAEEMSMIQAALDRIVSLIQDGLTPDTPPRARIEAVAEPDE